MALNIMTEQTLQKILGQTQLSAALLAAIAGAAPGSVKVESFESILKIVDAGLAPKVFGIGDQIIDQWTDVVSGTVYDWVWDIAHIGESELENGTTVPSMTLLSHYLTPFAIQFDAAENEVATEGVFTEGYYYYLKNEDNSFSLQEVTYGDAIPTDATYYHSAIRDTTGNICRYGYNRWSHCAYRQFLNSVNGKGGWWEAQHLGDVAPNELNSRAGFLTGFSDEFLSVIQPTKIRTWLNTVTDKDVGGYEDTYDLMWLPSKEQVYGALESGSYNDVAFDYYKQATGLSAPSNAENTGRIKYKIDSKATADWHRLRSPIRGNSYSVWSVSAGGNVSATSAYGSGRAAVACTICKSR